MSYTISYQPAGYILLYSEGKSSLADLREALRQGTPLVLERNCFRVLSDFRKMKLTLSILDLFSIPAIQAALSRETGLSYHRFRRAVLVSEADFERYKFFETVAVNRFHLVKVFLDETEAIAWLLEK